MPDVRAGGAYVEIGADRRPFDAALSDVQRSLSEFASSVSRLGKEMMAIGGTIAGAFVTASKLMVDVAENAVDASTRTGLTITQVQTLGFAAKQAGASFEELEIGLKFFQRGLADVAETGRGPAADALRVLGLRAKDLIAMSPQDQIFAVADAIAKIENPAIRSNVALDLFSRSGTRLLPMLSAGSAGIRKMQAEAIRLGGVMSEQAAIRAEAFGDRLEALKASILGVAINVGEALLPTLESFIEKVIDAAIQIQGWIERNQETVVTILKIGVYLLTVGAALWTFGKIVAIVAGIVKAFQYVLLVTRVVMALVRRNAILMWGAILGPIGIAIAGFLMLKDAIADIEEAKGTVAELRAARFGQRTETIDTIGGRKIPVSPGGTIDIGDGIGALSSALRENTDELRRTRAARDSRGPAGDTRDTGATTHDVVTRGRAGASRLARPRG